MNRRKMILHRTADALDLPGDLYPSTPLLEIYGNHRVLMENHCGVAAYSSCEITVRTNVGTYSIAGDRLEICSMTKHRIIISGIIASVALKARGPHD